MQLMPKEKIKTWFVTGTSSGVGHEMCRQLLARGYNVVAVARRPTEIPEFHGSDNSFMSIQADVSNYEQISNAINAAIKKFGRIDVLANNAGITSGCTLEEISDEEMHRVMETNFWGIYNTMKCLLPHFRKNGHGTIINNTSQSGISVRSYGAAYCASKHAAEGLTASVWHDTQRFCRVMAFEMGVFHGTEIGRNRPTQITQIDEYKNLPPFFRPFVRDYRNSLEMAVGFIIDTVEREKMPRRLMLGRDALFQINAEIESIRDDLRASRKMACACSIPLRDIDRTVKFCGVRLFKRRVHDTYVKYYVLGMPFKKKKRSQ